MKNKETLEEAAERIAYDSAEENKGFPSIAMFKRGAKWQQKNSNINALDFEIDSLKREIKVLKHQQERSYSEEEMLQALNIGYTSTDETWQECEDFAKEQFKKK